MKTLIIITNSSKTSFTHAVANAYAEGAKSVGKEVEILDLYDINQPFFRYESTEALRRGELQSSTTEMKMIQEKITRSDEMVYVFPIRRGGIPAMLKNFFDTNFSSGFAFKFVKGSNKPKKLLSDKTAKIFTHCDAPAFLYRFAFISGVNIKRYLSGLILSFCGIKTTQYTIMGSLSKSSDEKREQHLAAVRNSGAKK